jgi:YidC/Oxa1 family membrane protein insertase
MKNLRAFLWIGLGLILFVNYQTWQLEFAPRDAEAAAAEQQAIADAQANAPAMADVPEVGAPVDQPPAAGTTPAGDVPTVAAAAADAVEPGADSTAAVINVRTDVLDVDVSLEGGQLVRADLPEYRVKKGEDEVVRLLRQGGPDNQYLLQTGLNGAPNGAAATSYPTHHAVFTSAFTGFRLEPGLDELRVPLNWSSPEGVEVVKTLIFRRGSYRIDVQYEVKNASPAAWSVAPYAQIVHDMPPLKRSYFNVDSYSFTGPAYWDGSKYQKVKPRPDNAADFNAEYPDGWTDGWIASLQHHFVVAVVPPSPEEQHRHQLTVNGDMYRFSDVGPTVAVAPGASASIDQILFVGPKLQHKLAAIHPELDRAADFGKLTFLAQPLFWLLEQAHRIFGNWGFAIIAITFLLKLAFYPLSEISGRTSAKMKLLAPRLKQLQEQYKDDRTKLGQATMELYKKEGANPATGCLPMIIQLPVFMAFYWVLLESVEMRQAPFIGWIHDLSSRDPLFILPVIMAGAMFLQYRIQPPSADPMQAKIFMIMPIVMSVTFAFFPAGLVLYWVTNTILTILQQWNINRRIEAARGGRN